MELYHVPSSDATKPPYTVRRSGGRIWCDCKGWQFSKSVPKTCRHNKLVKAGKVEASDQSIATSRLMSNFQRFKTKQMTFIKPMLAHKATPKMEFARKTWTVEEKFDGHRLIVSVQNGAVTAWSRKGLERALPPHVLADLVKLPDGTYDGELITKGGRSYDVVNKERAADRQFVIFDILRLLNRDITGQAYVHRRMYLREIFDKLKKVGKGIWLSPAWAVDTWNEAMGICREIWDRDGEGIILKRSAGSYHPGMRTKEFLKVKALKHATLVVTGFRPSKGEKINRGPFAIALLRDNKGNETKVKVLDDATLADLKRAWKARKRGATKHPYVGRKLCIEYQERTPDGGYRHPRWDRWEDE